MGEQCPACGSERLTETEKDLTIHEAFAGSKTIRIKVSTCGTCGFSGEFSDHNDRLRKETASELQQTAMQNILSYFSDNHYSFAGIERSLGLAQRTLTKWKSGATVPTKTALALFRLLRLFPWLLDVADEGFDTVRARKKYLQHSLEEFIQCIPDEQLAQPKADVS